MKLCFRFVAKLSTKMQNETQFLINFIVKINIKKFQQFFKTDFSTPLTLKYGVPKTTHRVAVAVAFSGLMRAPRDLD